MSCFALYSDFLHLLIFNQYNDGITVTNDIKLLIIENMVWFDDIESESI